MCLPALEALRAHHPTAHITILGHPWIADLYSRESFCDATIAYPKTWRAKLELARSLRGKFDKALLLQNAFEAAAFMTLAGAPVRTGYNRDGRRLLLTQAIPTPKIGHERFYYLELLRLAGWIPGYDPESPIHLKGITRQPENTIGVSPGAAFGSAKRWYPDRFADAAAQIAREHNSRVALFGSAADKDSVDIIQSELEARNVPVDNYVGRTTLTEFIQLAANCRLMLTNDSGAMHVAYAVGTPSVTVFGSTDHIGTGPVGPHARIVREPVDCAPCKLRECPIDHRCMTRISADRVAQEALVLLK
ncbi:MAG: glycosyltransferase family 9 protein [Acidobacteria bacterium]|nr:glycosyltransferase family 9 protein [Acidobacteriota bacterium]